MKITEGIVSSKVSPTGTHRIVTTVSGKTITMPKADWVEGSETISYMVHSKGDTFVASKDSSRTKGTVLGKDCPAGKEDEPLYFKGDSVSRIADSLQFDSFGTYSALSAANKGAIEALELEIKQLQVAKLRKELAA